MTINRALQDLGRKFRPQSSLNCVHSIEARHHWLYEKAIDVVKKGPAFTHATFNAMVAHKTPLLFQDERRPSS